MSSPSCPVNLTFTLAPKSEKHNPALLPDRQISPTSNGKLHSLLPCASTSPSHTFPLFLPWRLSWYHCPSVRTQHCAGRHCHTGDSSAARPSAQHSTSVLRWCPHHTLGAFLSRALQSCTPTAAVQRQAQVLDRLSCSTQDQTRLSCQISTVLVVKPVQWDSEVDGPTLLSPLFRSRYTPGRHTAEVWDIQKQP